MNATELHSDSQLLANCADQATSDATSLVLGIAAGVMALLSEALPFVRKVKSQGLLHAVYLTICESECLDEPAAAVDNKAPPINQDGQGDV